jgi:cell shape-determining protein MreC
MLILILILVIGSILVYISKFNFALVSVNLGFYIINNIPLFYVIVGSIVFGLVLSYLAYLFHSISNSFTLRSKNNEIKKNKDDVLDLTKQVHQLELENEKIKHEPLIEPADKNAL